MNPRNFVTCLCLLGSMAAAQWICAEDTSQPWAPKLAVSSDSSTAYIAQMDPGKILKLSATSREQATADPELLIETSATDVVDMLVGAGDEELLIACDQPPRIVRQPLHGGEATVIDLPAVPARMAMAADSDDHQLLCVSLPAVESVWIARLGNGKDVDPTRVRLRFSPKEMVVVAERMFLVVDGYGSRAALVDAGARRQASSLSLSGYHISGLAVDKANKNLLFSHQVLSSNARTDKDDVRWGSLIQNNVSAVALRSVLAMNSQVGSQSIYRLGNFGHGSADPAGIVCLEDGCAVAISGADEVGVYAKSKQEAKFTKVGHVPERLFRFGVNDLLCAHRLDQRIAWLSVEDGMPKLRKMIGRERPVTTAFDRGELAFYSGELSLDGWMSCNSCHIDGHTPDLLVDTLGDGTYDSPKKIPTLGQVTKTGPWAWHGRQSTLREQIDKTLGSTMHTPDELSSGTVLVRESLTDDLIEYLTAQDRRATETTLTAKTPSADSDTLTAGEAIFQERCARCHDPDQHYTSPKSYDVGINDERGQKLFNPPSLQGLRHRHSFMHDGRYNSLDDVLRAHPQPHTRLTTEEHLQLKTYLQRL